MERVTLTCSILISASPRLRGKNITAEPLEAQRLVEKFQVLHNFDIWYAHSHILP
jgi:hypothetical protein